MHVKEVKNISWSWLTNPIKRGKNIPNTKLKRKGTVQRSKRKHKQHITLSWERARIKMWKWLIA